LESWNEKPLILNSYFIFLFLKILLRHPTMPQREEKHYLIFYIQNHIIYTYIYTKQMNLLIIYTLSS